MAPTPPPGFVGALVLILGGALAIALVGAALNARLAREVPHGNGDGTGDNGARNETQRRPPLRPAPPPRAVERQNPDGGLRDLEEARVERGGGGEAGLRHMMDLMLAMQVIAMVMMILQLIRSETNIPTLIELSLSVGFILFYVFRFL